MEKRGTRHTEVILSFVLFIFAIAFALWFFSPDGGVRRAESSIEYVFREVAENASVDFTTYSIGINSEAWTTTPSIIRFDISDVGTSMNARARFSDGSLLPVHRSGNSFYVSHPDWSTEEIVYLELSEEFSDGSVSTVSHEETYYTLGGRETVTVLSERKLLLLADEYFSNYSLLKDQFNVYVEFGFRVLFDDGSALEVERTIPEGLDVFSESRRVRILRDTPQQTVEFAEMLVRVW